jgi:hypothetical protein
MKLYIQLFAFALLPFLSSAQYLGNSTSSNNNTNNTTSASSMEQAVQSVEGITAKMLELISGPKGQARNWEDFRSLFLPSAQLISLNPNAQPMDQARALSIEEFIRHIGPVYSQQGFYESALNIVVHEFNGMANAFQSFTARNADGSYNARGINNYLLVEANNRWYIASSTWSNEDANHPLPTNLGQTTTTGNSTNPNTNTTTGSGKLGDAKKSKIILKK